MRLQGPCFKTGRIEPFGHRNPKENNLQASITKDIHTSVEELPCPQKCSFFFLLPPRASRTFNFPILPPRASQTFPMRRTADGKQSTSPPCHFLVQCPKFVVANLRPLFGAKSCLHWGYTYGRCSPDGDGFYAQKVVANFGTSFFGKKGCWLQDGCETPLLLQQRSRHLGPASRQRARQPESPTTQQRQSSTAQEHRSPTAQEPYSPTAQQPNGPTAPQPNNPAAQQPHYHRGQRPKSPETQGPKSQRAPKAQEPTSPRLPQPHSPRAYEPESRRAQQPSSYRGEIPMRGTDERYCREASVRDTDGRYR